MNWTEGNLARHSRGRQRNQPLARQKQHFAKARNNVLNDGAKQSPITISFLGHEHVADRHHRDKIPSELHTSPLQLVRKHHHERHKERSLSKVESTSRLSDRAHGSKPGHDTQQASDKVRLSRGDKRPLGPQLSGSNDGQSSQLHEKRRKLLKKADWVGISSQQLLAIDFTGQRTRHDGLGWSRPVGHQRRQNNLRTLIDANRTSHGTPQLSCKPYSSGQHGQGFPLRIQIGSQEIQPSITTSSHINDGQASLVSRKTHNSPRAGTGSSSSRFRQQHISRSDNRMTAKNKSALLPSGPKPRTVRHGGDTSQSSTTDAATGEANFPHVVCSSSIIHEPVPRRAGAFKVLQWRPSDVESESAESIEAQVGRLEPTVPASQAIENETWRLLTAQSDEESESTAPSLFHYVSPTKPDISPGISALPSQLEYELPSLSLLETSSPKSQHIGTEAQEPVDAASLINIPEETPGHLDLSSTPNHSTIPSQVPAPVLELGTTGNICDETKAKPSEKNEEQAWMDFVFEDNSDELRDKAFKEAAYMTSHDLKPSDTSDSTDNWSLLNNNSSVDPFDSAFPPGAPVAETLEYGDAEKSCIFDVFNMTPSPVTADESQVATKGTQGTLLSDSSKNISTETDRPLRTSPRQKSAGTGFRFAAPKAFVGKLADAISKNKRQATQYTSTSTKSGTGRRKRKRAMDGRPSIRNLPNHDDDPIEEF